MSNVARMMVRAGHLHSYDAVDLEVGSLHLSVAKVPRPPQMSDEVGGATYRRGGHRGADGTLDAQDGSRLSSALPPPRLPGSAVFLRVCPERGGALAFLLVLR